MNTFRHMNSYVRLLLYTLISVAVFSILAICIVFGLDAIETFFKGLLQFIYDNCWIILWVFAAVQLISALFGYFKVEALMKLENANPEYDEEDDLLSYRIEAWTTYTNFIGHLLFILSVILFTISTPGSKFSEPYLYKATPPFLIGSVILCIYCIAYVKQAQRRDPSKKGDPAQLRFNRDWLESCDEAEKEIAYQASYKTLTVLGWCTPIFLLLAMWGHLMFQTGVLSIVIVGVIWGISSLTYLLFKLKLLKTKINQ